MTDAQGNYPDHGHRRFEEPSVDLGKYATNLIKVVTKGVEDVLADHGIVPIEFSVLRLCLERTELTATDLAEELPIDASRVSRLVNRLVEKDLLARRRLTQDRRVVMLRLTEHGDELTHYLLGQLWSYYARITENINEDDLQQFAATASVILANYEAMSPLE